jgi:hypothetical protein
MSEKMTCPGCGSHSSSVLADYRAEKPCRNCGLSWDAATEILDVQERTANEELKAKLAEALKRADKAEDKARRLRNHLNGLLSKAQEVSQEMDDPKPWLKDW